jgi:hypothetical protein
VQLGRYKYKCSARFCGSSISYRSNLLKHKLSFSIMRFAAIFLLFASLFALILANPAGDSSIVAIEDSAKCKKCTHLLRRCIRHVIVSTQRRLHGKANDLLQNPASCYAKIKRKHPVSPKERIAVSENSNQSCRNVVDALEIETSARMERIRRLLPSKAHGSLHVNQFLLM